jgi:hypothetical protein
MKRAVGVALAALLAAAVLLDPYTLHQTASDAVLPAPAWRLALGLADVALLAAVGVLAFRREWPRASDVLTVETIFALSLAIALVTRDGVGRFVRGFAAEEYVSLYLASIAVRVLLLRIVQPPRGQIGAPAT